MRLRFQLVAVRACADTDITGIADCEEGPGDPDQSIYGWRNANVANLNSRIMQEFGGRGRSVRLGEGYRSTQHILTAAHMVISQGAQACDVAHSTSCHN